jgi:Dolichyl-phosphate-mannose-protein mannosyltransferase
MPASIVLPSGSLPRAGQLGPLHAVGVSLAVIVVWAFWAAAFNTAQFGDNVEQFNWAQSLELGYHKHPPLPSWVLGSVIKIFGPSIYWAYGLATLCLIGTSWLTWLIGRELVGERTAAAACLLWGLNMTFSQRVQLYNHNTVLVLCFAATVWCAMRASRAHRGPLGWWALTGLMAGAATLSKYQALVPLGGLLLALAMSGRLKTPLQRSGVLLAIATMIVVCAPHAAWVARHDFSTLRYASEAIETAGLGQRLGFIVAFVANQLRLWSPALLAIGLYWGWGRFRPVVAATTGHDQTAADWPAWAIGLLWFGIVALAVMALAAGVSLRNHWGVQALQFLAVWLAWRWDRKAPIDLKRLVVAVLAVHTISLAWYASEHHDPTTVLTSRRIDTMYPARRLARAAIAHWQGTTNCPLRYVTGTVFDAGLVSLYSGGKLEVFDTESATPWVDPAQFRQRGALYVLDSADAMPPGLSHVISFDVVPGDRRGRPPKTITLGVLMPEVPCAQGALP